MKGQITEFDHSKEYEKKLSELVHEVVKICNRNDIPCLLTFCIKNNEEESKYVTEYLSPGQKMQHLKTDYFAGFVNVLNGFRTVPFEEEVFEDLEISEDELNFESITHD